MNTSEAAAWSNDDAERAKIENRGLSTNKYVRGRRLGLGGSSIVYKTLRVSDGKVLAGKSSKAPKDLEREADILGLLQHVRCSPLPRNASTRPLTLYPPLADLHQEHIVAFVELYHDPLCPVSGLLLMELCPYGTLQARIDQVTPHMARGEVLSVVAAYCTGSGVHARAGDVPLGCEAAQCAPTKH
ncbi:hypothetical protein J3458_011730 [Metarhizium acridum]|uniref:uncharacterized protein n=1 Tax=Metarhizium acridum TaxID=92637 RepID=UPI001C6CCDBF|nr:hypothetical protein J3458_011730 [Metarhizium acridum]